MRDKRRLDSIRALIDLLLSLGAHQGYGANYVRWDIARMLGWSPRKLDHIVRFLRDNPQYGAAVTWKSGGGKVILSTTDEKIFGNTLRLAGNFGEIWRRSNLLRLVRGMASELMHISNSDKGMMSNAEKRLNSLRRDQIRGILVLLKASFPSQADEPIRNYIEHILQTL